MSDIKKTFHYDEYMDLTTIQSQQDITALVNSNKAEYNLGIKTGVDMRRVASIPLTVFEDLIKMKIFDNQFNVLDQKAFNRWLNDSHNQVFRTSPEHIG